MREESWIKMAKEEEEEDDFVCPDCGGDLADLGDDLYECVSCGEVYDDWNDGGRMSNKEKEG